ncbi:hypothetical protein [Natronorubrum halophilum]|uniref:hypothetical protein n=1 Tax=Natronorubrum halophilum TaxID=1702106 RepID=UPI0013CE4E4E|nr:hypothetical protein [Natronorubrum halophilum]
MDRTSGGTTGVGERCRFARRKFLALTGIGFTGTLAGCSELESRADGSKTKDIDPDNSAGFDGSFLAESASSHIGATAARTSSSTTAQ